MTKNTQEMVEAQQRAEKELYALFKKVFKTKDGKLALKKILVLGGVFRSQAISGPQLAVMEGTRALAMMIFKFARTDLGIKGRDLQEEMATSLEKLLTGD